jgi:tRNA-Thr(GGU) m(6)t(6)A37 methyltransferase TsaA
VFTKGIPIQTSYSKTEGTIKLFSEYSEGLLDLEGFSHIILLYHFHEVYETKLKVKPYLDDKSHGVFATRAPVRPNPIGISTVELLEVNRPKCLLKIRGVDMINDTPLIDIKPFIPHFDNREATAGWLNNTNYALMTHRISDDRF